MVNGAGSDITDYQGLKPLPSASQVWTLTTALQFPINCSLKMNREIILKFCWTPIKTCLICSRSYNVREGEWQYIETKIYIKNTLLSNKNKNAPCSTKYSECLQTQLRTAFCHSCWRCGHTDVCHLVVLNISATLLKSTSWKAKSFFHSVPRTWQVAIFLKNTLLYKELFDWFLTGKKTQSELIIQSP